MTLLALLLAFCLIDGFFDLLAKIVAFLLVLPFVLIGFIVVLARFMISLLFIFSDSPSESSQPTQKIWKTITEPDPSRLKLQWTNDPS